MFFLDSLINPDIFRPGTTLKQRKSPMFLCIPPFWGEHFSIPCFLKKKSRCSVPKSSKLRDVRCILMYHWNPPKMNLDFSSGDGTMPKSSRAYVDASCQLIGEVSCAGQHILGWWVRTGRGDTAGSEKVPWACWGVWEWQSIWFGNLDLADWIKPLTANFVNLY